ncbi:MAG: flagellar filament capping protein FliD [Firmicutes bacterium]|nr:flagellar filament capping protein FliD [Bacillota bacterium]
MSISLPSLMTGTSQLDELVKRYIELESKPLDRLKQTRSDLEVRSAMFTDLKASLAALEGKARELADAPTSLIFDQRLAVSSDANFLSAQATTAALKTTHSIFIERVATADTVVSNQLDSTGTTISGAGAGVKTFDLTVAGETKTISVTVAAGDTDATVLANMAQAINDSGAKVRAAVVSEVAGKSRLVLTSTLTGQANAITLTEAGGADSNLLSLTGTSSSVQSTGTTGGYLVPRANLDAKFSVDGLTFYRSSNVVDDVLTGVTLTLKAAQATGSAPLTLEIKQDISGAKAKIQAFVDQYNKTLKYLQDKTIIDADAGIRGPLAGEFVFSNLKTRLRTLIQEPVAGMVAPAPTSLFQIGIEADDTGALKIADSSKLEAALSSQPGAVADLFGSTGGVAVKLRDLMSSFVEDATGIVPRQQEGIGDKIRDIDNRIKALQERLDQREKALRQEFASMLQAMAMLNAQSATLRGFMNAGISWGV